MVDREPMEATVRVRVPVWAVERLDALARQRYWSRSQVVRELLLADLREIGPVAAVAPDQEAQPVSVASNIPPRPPAKRRRAKRR